MTKYIEKLKDYDMKIIISCIIAIIITATILIEYNNTHKQFTVKQFSWETEIQIEEYKTCHEEGWSIPSGGRETDRERRVHHWDDYIDHYDKDGEPVYESEPVYRTYYFYDIDRWVYSYSETDSDIGKKIRWKEYTLPEGNFREGKRIVTYMVDGRLNNGKRKSYKCNEDIFKILEINGTFEIVTDILDKKIIKLK